MGSSVNVGKIDSTVHTSGFNSHVHSKVCMLESFNYIDCASKIIFKISKNCTPPTPQGYLQQITVISPAVAWFEMTVMVMPHRATSQQPISMLLKWQDRLTCCLMGLVKQASWVHETQFVKLYAKFVWSLYLVNQMAIWHNLHFSNSKSLQFLGIRLFSVCLLLPLSSDFIIFLLLSLHKLSG